MTKKLKTKVWGSPQRIKDIFLTNIRKCCFLFMGCLLLLNLRTEWTHPSHCLPPLRRNRSLSAGTEQSWPEGQKSGGEMAGWAVRAHGLYNHSQQIGGSEQVGSSQGRCAQLEMLHREGNIRKDSSPNYDMTVMRWKPSTQRSHYAVSFYLKRTEGSCFCSFCEYI